MGIYKWFRIHYNKITGSIAFYPALIAIAFLVLSWAMIELDFSVWGKNIKANWSFVNLKDASTARSIISTIAGAIISLAVFSFSMVMIVLNQAASQMSNRVLTSMIENRFQQVTLGFYIGTIVYSLFLLSTIRDIDSGVYVPALSIYLLILFTVIDIFFFIYFLNYVTQTVKYETVIQRVKIQTLHSMKYKFVKDTPGSVNWDNMKCVPLKTDDANYFQGFSERGLLKIAQENNLYLSFLYPPSTFLIEHVPFMNIYSNEKIEEDVLREILSFTDFYSGQPIEKSPDYGFSQLAEIAIKALSPAINDPGTAVLSLHALTELLSYRLKYHAPVLLKDQDNIIRVSIQYASFQQLFEKCIHPIWSYGRKDQYIQNQILFMIKQLRIIDSTGFHSDLYSNLEKQIEQQKTLPIA